MSIPRYITTWLIGLALAALSVQYVAAQTPLTLRILSPSGKALDSIALRIAFADTLVVTGYTDREGLFTTKAPQGCTQAHLWAWGKGYATLEANISTEETKEQSHTLRLPLRTLPGVEVLRDQRGSSSPTSESYRVSPTSLPQGAKADQALRRLPGLLLTDEGVCLIGATSLAPIYVNEVPASIGFIRSLPASDLDQVEVHYRDTQTGGEGGAVYITLRRETTNTLRGDLLASAGVLRPEYRLHPSLSLYTQRFDLRLFSAVSYSHLYPETHLYQSGREVLRQSNEDRSLSLALGGLVNIYLSPELQGTGSLRLGGRQLRSQSRLIQPMSAREGSLSEQEGSLELNLLLAYRPSPTQRLLVKTRGRVQGNTFADLSDRRYSLGDLSIATDLVYEQRGVELLSRLHDLTFTLGQQEQRSRLHGLGGRYQSTQLHLLAEDQLQLSSGLSATLTLGVQWGHYGLGAQRQYVTPLPSLALRYTRWGYTGRLSYTRYVEHPSAELLSPSPYYLHELEQVMGQPNLRPQSTDLVQLSLAKAFGGHALSLSASYHHQAQLIAAQLMEPSTDLLAFANVGSGHLSDLTLGYRSRFLSDQLGVKLYAGLTYAAYLLDPTFRSQTRGRSSMGWEVRGGGELSYSLREGWLFDLSASYHSPRFLFGRRRTSDPLIQLGVQKQFLEGQLAVSLRAKAPFGLGERVQEYYRQRLHPQTKELHYSLWNISLGVSYHFDRGSEKPKPQLPTLYPDHSLRRQDMHLR